MKRPHQLIVPLLLPVALVSVIGLRYVVGETQPPLSAVAWAQSSPVGALDHFQCYEIKPSFFAQPSVTVQDQFGTMTETLRIPNRLCNPTDKNGEGITDPTDHLVGYRTKAPKFTTQFNQTVVDQFGTQILDVKKPDDLLVPSSKGGVAQQPPLDHFQCYRVKKSKGAPRFVKKTASITNQFETATVTLVKPRLLCAPASKNGEDPTAPSHPDHLICYKTKDGKFGTLTTTVTNQFGVDEVTVIHRRELCVPALKNPGTTTTTIATTTTTIATTTTTTSTTIYGSPSRAFLVPSVTLLD